MLAFQILNALFYDEWTVLARLKASKALAVKLPIFNQEIYLRVIAKMRVDAVLSVGGKVPS